MIFTGITLMLILSACGGEQGALKEETLYFNPVHPVGLQGYTW